MNVGATASSVAVTQTGKAEFDMYGFGMILTVDGAGGKSWPIKPHISILL